MKIYVTRHGQTNLNKQELMQGRVDEPLNETGIAQAKQAAQKVADVKFDAVYASPLDRAKKTAAIIGHVDEQELIIDERIIEAEFGKYDKRKYSAVGLWMSLYWGFPEIFPAPKTVEKVSEMVERSSAFMKELESKDYENVLVVCHGGIIRAICGYLEDKKNGIKWRPRPTNCEIRVYEYKDGTHTFIESYKNEEVSK